MGLVTLKNTLSFPIYRLLGSPTMENYQEDPSNKVAKH